MSSNPKLLEDMSFSTYSVVERDAEVAELVEKDLPGDIVSEAVLFSTLCYCVAWHVNMMPLTAQAVSKSVLTVLNNTQGWNTTEWYRLYRLRGWYYKETRLAIVKRWLEEESGEPIFQLRCLLNDIPKDNELWLAMLNRMCGWAKRQRRYVKDLRSLFVDLNDKLVPEACNILLKQTPLVAGVVLSRKDIPDDLVKQAIKKSAGLTSHYKVGIETTIRLEHLKMLPPTKRYNFIMRCATWRRSYNADLFAADVTKEAVNELLFASVLSDDTKRKRVSYLMDRFLQDLP